MFITETDRTEPLFPRHVDDDRFPGWVGDDRVPTIDSIQTCMRIINEALLAPTAINNDLDRMVMRHNLLTTHLGLGLAIATGLRNIRTPIIDLTLVDRQTGFICLREKDHQDGNHTRLVVLPSVVIAQIMSYLAHLGRLFTLWREQITNMLKVRSTKWRDKQRHDKEVEIDLTRSLFFIDPTDSGLVVREFTGTRLKQEIDALQPGLWPVANAGRHFLRTRLVDAGVPETVINTQLGHWSHGEEPWALESSLSPAAFRKVLRPILDSLMDRVGFEVIE